MHCDLIIISEWTWNAQHLQQHLIWLSCGRSITVCTIILMLFHFSGQLSKNVAITVFRPMDVQSVSWLMNEVLVMQFLNLQIENCNVGPFC